MFAGGAAQRLRQHGRQAMKDNHELSLAMQRVNKALTAMRSGSAPAFYADLVRGASPQVLLANLKGQIDQLATRVGG